MARFQKIIVILTIFLCVGVFVYLDPLHWVAMNRSAVEALRGEMGSGAALGESRDELSVLVYSNCHANWLLGMTLKNLGDEAGKTKAWERLLGCSRDEVEMLLAAEPQNMELAISILEIYPDEEAAWFRWGDLVKSKNPETAISLFKQAVGYRPADGLAWCRLGSLYENTGRLEQGRDAYVNCCRNDDPGSNGCWGAGRVLEKLGEPQKALEYYRMSTWETALQRADELEKELRAGGAKP